MNTIQIQLNDEQYDDLITLLDYARSDLESDLRNATDEESTAEAVDLLDAREKVLIDLVGTKSYLWTSGCGRIELVIPAAVVGTVAQSGDNEPACRQAIKNHGYLASQLAKIDGPTARENLKDYGIETERVDAMSFDDLKLYTLWIACHDIKEEAHQAG